MPNQTDVIILLGIIGLIIAWKKGVLIPVLILSAIIGFIYFLGSTLT